MTPPQDATPQPSEAAGGADQLSYEAARAELLQVVTSLESGGVPLADSMALWERGEQLAAICQGWLDGAKAKVAAARKAAQQQSD